MMRPVGYNYAKIAYKTKKDYQENRATFEKRYLTQSVLTNFSLVTWLPPGNAGV